MCGASRSWILFLCRRDVFARVAKLMDAIAPGVGL
jgi:hypothetical protein